MTDFGASEWPRVYELSRRGARNQGAGLAAYAAVVVAGCAGIAKVSPAGAELAALLLVACALPWTIALAVWIAREDLVGRRVQRGGLQPIPVIERRDGSRVRLVLAVDADDAFHLWLAPLPDLDARDAAGGSERAIRALGGEKVLRRARHIAWSMNAAVAVWVAGLFWPTTRALAMVLLAAWPLVTMAIARPAMSLGFDEASADPRPSVLPALFCPAVPLMFLASRIEMVDVAGLVLGAAPLSVSLTALAARRHPELTRPLAAALLVAAVLWAHAAASLVLANAHFDRHASTITRVAVRARPGDGREPILTLAPWEPGAEARSVHVGRALYDATRVGDVVCLELHQGALGARWLEVRACE